METMELQLTERLMVPSAFCINGIRAKDIMVSKISGEAPFGSSSNHARPMTPIHPPTQPTHLFVEILFPLPIHQQVALNFLATLLCRRQLTEILLGM